MVDTGHKNLGKLENMFISGAGFLYQWCKDNARRSTHYDAFLINMFKTET